jgi:hypothetical protein
MHMPMMKTGTFLLSLIFLVSIAGTAFGIQDQSDNYGILVDLYSDFRSFHLPEVENGVPVYTAEAMARQFAELRMQKN